MELHEYIINKYPSGMTYFEAGYLCMWFHCRIEFCPAEFKEIALSKDALASEFAELYKANKILDYSDLFSVFFGASFHSPSDKGHWLEVIGSIYKKGLKLDIDLAREFDRRFKI